MKPRLVAAIFCLFAGVACALNCCAQNASPPNQWGENFNSPGATLKFKETAREVVSDRTVVTYNLLASGLPKDRHYILWMLGLGQDPRAMTDAYLNGEGKVVNVLADPAHQVAEDAIDLRMFGSKGEPFQFAVISDDGTLRAFTLFVPFPMEKTSGTCRLSVIEGAPHYEAVTVNVTGLQPNETFVIEMHSENEGGRSNVTASPQGTYASAVFPFVKGETSGKARVAVEAQSCKLEIEFPWGQGSQKYQ
jgi:hypothetical protein